MGGDLAQTVQPAKKAVVDPITVQQPGDFQPIPGLQILADAGQPLEIHINKGEVHFHDREAEKAGIKQKAAIPVHEWYNVWGRLKSMAITEWRYLDIKNNTTLTITLGMDSKNRVEARLQLEPMALGSTFEQLDTFTTKAGKA